MTTTTPSTQRRRQLLSIYQSALQSVNGERTVRGYLERHPLAGNWAVVALGKAAAAMALGAERALGTQLHSGLVVTKYGHGEPRLRPPVWEVLESGHPIPDGRSLAAGERLLRYLEELPAGMPLLFLLSGGASALAEVLPEDIGLDELARVNDWLLASGLAIGEMNTIRKRLSRLKGGRLALHLQGRRCLQLLIADVPADDPATIGSAPLYPPADTPLPASLPGWLLALLELAEPPPAADDPVFQRIETHIVASNALARQAAADRARVLGLRVIDHPGHFQGDAGTLAADFVAAMQRGGSGIYLWGGESSVALPPEPGCGGRNQHLALAAALLLAGEEHCLLLAAGSDGSDGPTEEAGALVDGGSVARGEEEGLSAAEALRDADSGRFLEASGDLIETGPTGTNVMDLVIGWKWDEPGTY
jgi:hydroxypyruvate reductase